MPDPGDESDGEWRQLPQPIAGPIDDIVEAKLRNGLRQLAADVLDLRRMETAVGELLPELPPPWRARLAKEVCSRGQKFVRALLS